MIANQQSPSFEDLEPEGEDIEVTDSLENMDNFEAEDLETEDVSDFPIDILGEYTFEALEASEDLEPGRDGFSENAGSGQQPSNILANLAAHTALQWGSQATTSQQGHGRRPVTPQRYHPPARSPRQEYLDEPPADIVDSVRIEGNINAWSATLREAYELMEVLAAAAATAGSKTEAAGLVAAIVPLSICLAPNTYRALWPALPALIQGTVGVTRLLQRQSATRPLIKLLPVILTNTTTQLAWQAQQGQIVTQRLAAKVLAKQMAVALRQRRGPRPTSRRAVRSKSRSHGLY